MKTETKREVFDETLSNLKKMDAQIEGEWGYSQLTMGVGKHGDVESIREIAIAEIRARYAATLPDDLPVIPKAVGEYIKDNEDLDLLVALTFASKGYKHSELWIAMHQNVFSLAWVLGSWRVEENGEVVKLEAEK